EETGISVEAVRGRGYKVRGGLELLESQQILACMSPASRPLVYALQVETCVGSTNDLALEVARFVAKRGLVITAEQQSAGRGRRGREWGSPFARNIYCSVLWSFDNGARAVEGLSLAVGVAIAEGLADIGRE